MVCSTDRKLFQLCTCECLSFESCFKTNASALSNLHYWALSSHFKFLPSDTFVDHLPSLILLELQPGYLSAIPNSFTGARESNFSNSVSHRKKKKKKKTEELESPACNCMQISRNVLLSSDVPTCTSTLKFHECPSGESPTWNPISKNVGKQTSRECRRRISRSTKSYLERLIGS